MHPDLTGGSDLIQMGVQSTGKKVPEQAASQPHGEPGKRESTLWKRLGGSQGPIHPSSRDFRAQPKVGGTAGQSPLFIEAEERERSLSKSLSQLVVPVL